MDSPSVSIPPTIQRYRALEGRSTDEFGRSHPSILVTMAVASASTIREQELLDAARGGDEGAFNRIVEGHRTQLLAHCYRMLGSMDDAEDMLQETLLRAWRGLPRFAGRSSLRTWLYRIASRQALVAIR